MDFVKGQDSAAGGLLHSVLDASPNKDTIATATSESDDVAIVQDVVLHKRRKQGLPENVHMYRFTFLKLFIFLCYSWMLTHQHAKPTNVDFVFEEVSKFNTL